MKLLAFNPCDFQCLVSMASVDLVQKNYLKGTQCLEAFRWAIESGDLEDTDWKPLPDDVEGIGYMWIPVYVTGDCETFMQNCKCTFMTHKKTPYSNDEITSDLLRSVYQIGCRAQTCHLGLAPRYTDPQGDL